MPTGTQSLFLGTKATAPRAANSRFDFITTSFFVYLEWFRIQPGTTGVQVVKALHYNTFYEVLIRSAVRKDKKSYGKLESLDISLCVIYIYHQCIYVNVLPTVIIQNICLIIHFIIFIMQLNKSPLRPLIVWLYKHTCSECF